MYSVPTSKYWPEATVPEPRQLRAWFMDLTVEEQIDWMGNAQQSLGVAAACMMGQHEDHIRYLQHSVASLIAKPAEERHD